MLVLSSVQHALRLGLAWPKVVRILLDAIRLSYSKRSGAGPALSEAESLRVITELMGISKAEARRYMAMAKAMETP